MITHTTMDRGQAFDWGKTSDDYALYRPGYPVSFYTVLPALGIGTAGQDILDVGTGTGVLARAFASQGAHEEAVFPARSFDIVSCGQSWLYFDTQRMIPLVQRWLKPGGKLVLTYLCWLPRQDHLARASEQLMLRYNPSWSDADFPGSRTVRHAWSTQDFRLVTYHAYEEGIPFTRDGWRGRIRACRGIGAALTPEEVARFDQEHDALLRQIAPDTFTILHQIWLHAYTSLGDADTASA